MKLNKFIKVIASVAGIATLSIGTTFALVSCSKSEAYSSESNARGNLSDLMIIIQQTFVGTANMEKVKGLEKLSSNQVEQIIGKMVNDFNNNSYVATNLKNANFGNNFKLCYTLDWKRQASQPNSNNIVFFFSNVETTISSFNSGNFQYKYQQANTDNSKHIFLNAKINNNDVELASEFKLLFNNSNGQLKLTGDLLPIGYKRWLDVNK